MGERRDVGRADGIVSGSERGGTSISSCVDRCDLPPPRKPWFGRIGNSKHHTLSKSSACRYRVHYPPLSKGQARKDLPLCRSGSGCIAPVSSVCRSCSWVITLPRAPLQVGVMVILAVPVNVQHIGQVVRVGHECLGHQTVNLECLAT